MAIVAVSISPVGGGSAFRATSRRRVLRGQTRVRFRLDRAVPMDDKVASVQQQLESLK